MSKNPSNPNIEWKKPGFDDAERETRKTDAQKAEEYGFKKKRDMSPRADKSTLPLSLNKIRKKIRVVIDEDEDEDEYQVVAANNMTNNSLVNALNEEEKSLLKQKEERDNVRLQTNTAKIDAMLVLNRFIKESGLKELDKKNINKDIDNPVSNPTHATKEAIRNDIAKKENIKWEDLDDKEIISFLRGVKKIRDVGGNKAIEKMKINDIVKAGHKETDEKKIAKMILKKSGRNRKAKKIAEKVKVINLKPKQKTVLDKVYGRV